MPKSLIAFLVAGFAALVVLSNTFYMVTETQQALVLQFGNPVKAVREPGLQFKIPFIQNVEYMDKRAINLNNPQAEVIMSDQKRVVVDAFALFKITDPLKFYQTVLTIQVAQTRLTNFMNTSLRNVLGQQTFYTVLSGERAVLMADIAENMNLKAKELGITIVDVRIRRADLPEENSQAVFRRMQTERQQEAAEFRAQGREAALQIRSEAERRATVIVAEATRDGEKLRGEGDAERNKVFANAFNRDPEFFDFYRSMRAYEEALANGETTTMVLSPDSDFFRFFGNNQ